VSAWSGAWSTFWGNAWGALVAPDEPDNLVWTTAVKVTMHNSPIVAPVVIGNCSQAHTTMTNTLVFKVTA